MSTTEHEEGLTPGEYPIWSPYNAHEAAVILMRLVEIEHDEAKEGSTAEKGY